jgi:hypothetical protein
MKLTIHGIDSRADHFATAAEQSQHVDEFIVMAAELRADDFRVPAVLSQRFDGLGQRYRVIGRNCGALFGLAEAGTAVRSIGSQSGHAYGDKQWDDNDETGSRHRWGC